MCKYRLKNSKCVPYLQCNGIEETEAFYSLWFSADLFDRFLVALSVFFNRELVSSGSKSLSKRDGIVKKM